MHTYPLSSYMRHIDAGRWEEVASMLIASTEKLRQAGADFLICPDNTAHYESRSSCARAVGAVLVASRGIKCSRLSRDVAFQQSRAYD
jgi:aspartate/glutamate racemase